MSRPGGSRAAPAGRTVGEPCTAVRLRDGRVLGLLEVGATDGPAAIHFHGGGCSRLEALFFADAARELGVRLICLDRPGIGRSDPHPKARLLDWADDVREVADQLGLERFAVLGMSSGAPFALACALRLADRVTGCGLISGLPPPQIVERYGPSWMRTGWALARRLPGPSLAAARLVTGDAPRPAGLIEAQVRATMLMMSPAERRAFAAPDTRRRLTRAIVEHYRQGGRGGREDLALVMRPWGFEPGRLAGPALRLWHGEQDRIVPCRLARRFAATLPGCTGRYFEGDGHFSLLFSRTTEILGEMVPWRASNEGSNAGGERRTSRVICGARERLAPNASPMTQT